MGGEPSGSGVRKWETSEGGVTTRIDEGWEQLPLGERGSFNSQRYTVTYSVRRVVPRMKVSEPLGDSLGSLSQEVTPGVHSTTLPLKIQAPETLTQGPTLLSGSHPPFSLIVP